MFNISYSLYSSIFSSDEKSQLELEKNKSEIADLKTQLEKKQLEIDNLKKQLEKTQLQNKEYKNIINQYNQDMKNN